MPSTASRRRTFLSPPRDYIHRRRFRRRLINLIFIPLLSVLAAYIITRPTGGAGFTLPKAANQASVSASAGHESPILAAASAPANGLVAGSLADPVGSSVASPPAVPILSGPYMLADGPHAVTEVSNVVLHDGQRNKDIHLRVIFPDGPGPYPVIVFSAGDGASASCCDALTRHWATYGYVTLQPAHDDSALERPKAHEEENNSMNAARAALKDPALWQSRPRDISFVLDSLPDLQNRIPALAGKIDAQHVGVGGHAMGAFTADVLAGAVVDLPGRVDASFADPRVKAVLLLSPPGPGEFGLTSHSWEHVSLPLLSMTGSLDLGAGKQSPEWREIPFERSQPGDKYQVFIQGADHMSFVTAKTFLQGRPARSESVLGYTNSASLAFWDAYLKADPEAKIYLQSGALSDFSHGVVKLSRR